LLQVTTATPRLARSTMSQSVMTSCSRRESCRLPRFV
jgi:hypothetical protein